MNATIGQIQDMATAGNQEHFKFEEVSDMKAKNQISKWINGNNAVKMIAGLALGAMFMTAIALPSNVYHVQLTYAYRDTISGLKHRVTYQPTLNKIRVIK